MAWVKIDDQFYAHPKLIAAGPLAKSLFVDSLCYANQYLTDGFIPRMVALQISMPLEQYCDVGDEIVTVLVQVGLWHEVDGGYQIHDYLDYNPSREQVIKDRAAAKERMQRVRGATNNQRSSPELRPNTPRSSSEVQECSLNPVPDPVPVSSKELRNGAANADAVTDESQKNKRGTRFPDDATLTQEFIDAANDLDFPDDRIAWEFDEFKDYWIGVAGSKGVKLDWIATWRNHLRRHIAQRGALTPMRKPGEPAKQPYDPNALEYFNKLRRLEMRTFTRDETDDYLLNPGGEERYQADLAKYTALVHGDKSSAA